MIKALRSIPVARPVETHALMSSRFCTFAVIFIVWMHRGTHCTVPTMLNLLLFPVSCQVLQHIISVEFVLTVFDFSLAPLSLRKISTRQANISHFLHLFLSQKPSP
jgi:hypothetical protein